jgi:hypothetical protein
LIFRLFVLPDRSEGFRDTPAEGMMGMAAVSMKLHGNNDTRIRASLKMRVPIQAHSERKQ